MLEQYRRADGAVPHSVGRNTAANAARIPPSRPNHPAGPHSPHPELALPQPRSSAAFMCFFRARGAVIFGVARG
jgi:hypothetical protein